MSDLTRKLRGIPRRLRRLTNRRQVQPQERAQAPAEAAEAESEVAAIRAELERLSQARDHDAVLALVAQHYDRFSGDARFLRTVRTVGARAGALSLQRRALADQATITPDDPKVTAAVAQVDGRWREVSPDWSPSVAPEVAATLPGSLEAVPGRVLHVLKISMPHRQSGYSMRTMYTLTGQVRAGLDPVGVTALDFPATVGIQDAAPMDEVGTVPHLRLLRETIPVKQPWADYLDDWATALAPVVAEQCPEVIHVHSGHRGYESALVALAVGEMFGIPVVYEVRGFFESLWTSDIAWSEQSEVYRLRRETETRCMLRAAAVVTLSESMRQDIVERGVPAEKVFVVPNGVDVDAFTPRERSAALRADLGLADRFVFGYVSNLDHYREGQELLIDAAVELRGRGVPATALIVGDGTRRTFLESRAQEVGAGDAVVFTGRVPHDTVLDYYAQYDVFVIPRVDERAARLVTPLKPFEAMATGIPLLVSDLPALREITGNGVRGLTFRTGEASSLADQLQELYADPARRELLARAGRDWVVAERQWAANGERYRTIYAGITSRA